MAQTFTSTKNVCRAWSRITFSFRSVLMPEVFFGHATQIMPSALIDFISGSNSSLNAAVDFANSSTTSRSWRRPVFEHLFSSSGKLFGALHTSTRSPSLIPSLFNSGVSEYPAMIFLPKRIDSSGLQFLDRDAFVGIDADFSCNLH